MIKEYLQARAAHHKAQQAYYDKKASLVAAEIEKEQAACKHNWIEDWMRYEMGMCQIGLHCRKCLKTKRITY